MNTFVPSDHHVIYLVDLLLLALHVVADVVLHEVVGELLVGGLGEHRLLPQVGGQVGVRLAYGLVRGLGKVAQGGGSTSRRGVAVVNAGHGQQLLGHRGADDACPPGGGDEAHQHTATPTRHLARDCVWLANLVTPVASPHRNNGKLGQDDGSPNGSCHFFGALHSQTNMSIVVSNCDKGLESGSLTGTGLLLDWHDLQNLIFQAPSTEECINNVTLLDWQ